MYKPSLSSGFTLIELILSIVLLGVLSAFALPRFANLESQAKTAVIEGIAGTMDSTIAIVKATARVQGVTVKSNSSSQQDNVIEMSGISVEVDWRNLCPESSAELGDAVDMLYFLNIDTSSAAGSGLLTSVSNQYTLVGYDLDDSSASACYVEYDSFGDPNCTVTVNTSGC